LSFWLFLINERYSIEQNSINLMSETNPNKRGGQRLGAGRMVDAGNPDFKPMQISEGMKLHIWDVVAHVIHSFAG
jgi:hypothetical protein